MTLPGLTIRERLFSPPLFLAPMAGVTHSAFRRLVSDFGGCGALFSEMLSGRALLREDLRHSSFTRRRDQEGPVIYQLLLDGPGQVREIVDRLREIEPAGIDVNLSCPAPEVIRHGGGAALSRNFTLCAAVLQEIRDCWDGVLSVKCRLGEEGPQWQDLLRARLRLFSDTGIDAVTFHPRFSGEKLKRTARWRELAWIAREAAMPVVGNGDIASAEDLNEKLHSASSVKGAMIGRMAAVKPWIFREILDGPVPVNYAGIWQRFCSYVLDDFPPEKALGRIKQFATYYSRNFFFGHEFFRRVQSSRSLDELRGRAETFLDAAPRTVRQPSVSGI